MNLSAVITEILKQRHAKVPMLEQVEHELLALSAQLEDVRSMAALAAEDVEDIPEEFRTVIGSVTSGVSSLQEEIVELIPRMANLTERFRKNTINIGVAGTARQGKSTLLQNISGLTDQEIPTSDELPCTGAKSKIYHFEGDPYARIDFYTADEFLRELIIPYFQRLQFPKPLSLREFEQPLPALNLDQRQERTLEDAIYERLTKIHQAFPSFKHLLSTSKTVPLSEIPEYVTQKNTLYLAVKAAHIFTKFPNHDVTGLCLVDLPGLEAAQNHEIKLVTSLEREVDAVILLKLPSSTGAQWDKDDYSVIDLIDKSVKEVQLNNWLFIVLNELEDGSNSKLVQLLKENPPSKHTQFNILISKCRNPRDAEQNVFSVVLDHLEHKLEEIDRYLLENITNSTHKILNDLTLHLSPVMSFFSSGQNDVGVHNKFWELFDRFKEDLGRNLEMLVKEVHARSYLDQAQQNFLAQVKEICDAGEQAPPIPAAQELENRFFAEGGWYGIVQKDLHHLRSHLTKHLADGLDVYLESMVEHIFRDVLVRAIPAPLLAIVTPQDAEVSARTLLEEFHALLDEHEHPELCSAFKYMFDFNFSYQSHFHYRVRQQMNSLDPLNNPACVSDMIPQDATAHHAPDIGRGLEAMYRQAISRIRKQFITEMQTDPGNAVFALVEEIRDRLVRSEHVTKEWRSFLYLRRGQVWPEEFSRFERETALRQKWQKMIEAIMSHGRTLQTTLR